MKIYNTLSKSKEDFVPIEPGKVTIYACGPTVYNYFHLGNARPFVTFDTLRRYLEYRGYEVRFCQNFTDIDDKIIQKANQEGVSIDVISERYINEYYVDADQLGILRPTYQPRATETIEEIVSMISDLLDKGFAYDLEDGLYFDVSKYDEYGRLSHFRLEDLLAGAGERVSAEDGLGKRNHGDFVLWKKKKDNEPAWPAPWGEGRPGWHIECSAMIKKHLGDTIDIHGGGQDLIFPHHENEIAQSTCSSGKPLARYWMHNAFVNVDNEKMSKSSGNFFMIRDIVQKYSYRVIRFFILSGHYRMPINFSDELLAAATNSLNRIIESVRNLEFVGSHRSDSRFEDVDSESEALEKAVTEAKEAFINAMDDDLNTADAITAIFMLVRAANSAASQNGKASAISLKNALNMIIELCGVLGINLTIDAEDEGVPAEIMLLVEQRAEAKRAKNFAGADAIRDQISALGFVVKDTPSGPQVTKQ
ncbi:MAG: cysteine--tRNA ligase [Clostridiaceae bacterium]|nr:cysteine--tRNA ligase [Clostridiaceae bacterium]